MVTSWKGERLQTGKPSQSIANTKVNSAFHPSGVRKSNTRLPACLARVEVMFGDDPIRQLTVLLLCGGFSIKSYTHPVLSGRY